MIDSYRVQKWALFEFIWNDFVANDTSVFLLKDFLFPPLVLEDLLAFSLNIQGFPFIQRYSHRTPWGGRKKRGEENLTKDTPPKKGFGTPLRLVCFASRVVALFFLYENTRLSTPEALFCRPKNFLGGAFSSPHTFAPPP